MLVASRCWRLTMAPRKRKPAASKARTILSVDPGASAGIALFVDERYAGSAAVNGASHQALYQGIMSLLQKSPFGSPAPHLCVIEDGFGRGIGAKTLDRRRGLAMGAAEAAGFTTFTYVYPGTWHSQMFVSRESAAMKSEAMAWCKKGLKLDCETHDQAEAVVLGFWAYGEYGQVLADTDVDIPT